MTKQQTPENKAVIIITFYMGSGDTSPERLSKKYFITNWKDEADLRRLLDKTAQEMNYLSGYGILTIKVDAEPLKFVVDYGDRYKPDEREGASWSI